MARVHPNHRTRPRRVGTITICVLACLVIVVSLVGWITRDAIQARRETKIRLQMIQTDRLLDAGILRAARRSENEPEYQGETWTPSLQLAGRDAEAAVTIRVADDETTVTAKMGIAPNITSKTYTFSSSIQ